MKFLRRILISLAVLLVLVALALISPIVQTWGARAALSSRPKMKGTLEAFTARFGMVSVSDLRLEYGDTVVTIPALQARMPVARSLLTRRAAIERLIGKGLVWDLTRSEMPVKTWTPEEVQQLLRKLVGDEALPFDLSLDEVNLEGDILLPAGDGRPPFKLHVVLDGRGLAAGKDGAILFKATCRHSDIKGRDASFSAHGTLQLAMDSPRTLKSISLKAGCLVSGAALWKDIRCDVDLGVAREGQITNTHINLSQDGRLLLGLAVQAPPSAGRLSGTWRADLKTADLAPFLSTLPPVRAAGEGTVDADLALTGVHANGRLKLTVGEPARIARQLGALGPITLDTQFDATHAGRTLHIRQLELSLGGEHPVAHIRSLQPVDCDEERGVITVADASADWFEASFTGIPLSWLSGALSGIRFAGGDLVGTVGARLENGAVVLRTREAFASKGVSIQHQGELVARDLDVSLALQARQASDGWQIAWSPFALSSGGVPLATSKGGFLLPEKVGAPLVLTGTWNVDLKALASSGAILGTEWMQANSAEGEGSLRLGVIPEFDGKLTVLGPTAEHRIDADLHLDLPLSGALSFRGPVKIALGKDLSELAVDGSVTPGKIGRQLNLKLSSKASTLAHLLEFSALSGALGAAPPRSKGAAVKGPFWGNWTGMVNLNFDRFMGWDTEMKELKGLFQIERDSIKQDYGSWQLPDGSTGTWKGSLTFDPSSAVPYTLDMQAALGEIDAAKLFGNLTPEKDPPLYGRFSLSGAMKGTGSSYEDILARAEKEYRLTGKGGILRMLKPSFAEAFVQKESRGANALGNVGDVMGSMFGINERRDAKPLKALDKHIAALYDFRTLIGEFRYDEISLLATRGADGIFRVTDLDISAPDLHITGTGEIAPDPKKPLLARPLKATLVFAFRKHPAELLATAKLLSGQTDRNGFSLFLKPIDFTGSFLAVDKTNWNAPFIEAASAMPVAENKGK